MTKPQKIAALAVTFLLTVAKPFGAEESSALILRGGWLFDATGESVVPNTGIVIRAGKLLEVGASLSGRDVTGFDITPFSAHRELHAMVLSGIPPADALEIATINGARALNVGDYLGTIEPGKLADLFVIRGNPLEDIRNTRNVRWVIKGGHRYDPKDLLKAVLGMIGPSGPDEITN